MNKILTAATAFAALSIGAVVLYKGGALTRPHASVVRGAEIASGLRPEFDSISLEEPRALPELRFVDSSGDPVSLADFRGKVVLLNIWATWCVQCRSQMPTLDRLQAKLGGPDFEVLALSIDQDGLSLVKAFYQELGLRAVRIYVEESGVPSLSLNVVGLPTTLFIDREGREIGRTIGAAEWDNPKLITVIRRYLDGPSAGALQSWSDRFFG